jgi:hypothetical protein
MLSSTLKSGPEFTETFDGRPLRIAIVHSRWNKPVIDALVNGAKKKLNEAGVLDQNIVTQTVPGSFELPLACQRSAPYPYFSYSSLLIYLFIGLAGLSLVHSFKQVPRRPIYLEDWHPPAALPRPSLAWQGQTLRIGPSMR